MSIGDLLQRRAWPVPFRPQTLSRDLVDRILRAAVPLPMRPGAACTAARIEEGPHRERILLALRQAGVDAADLALLEAAPVLCAIGSPEPTPEAAAASHVSAGQIALAAEEAGLAAMIVPLRSPTRLGDGVPEQVCTLVGLGDAAVARPRTARPGRARGGEETPPGVLLSLLEIAAATTAAEDLDRLLESIAQELARLFPVDRVDAAF
ncbi:MAG TPA: hypothetical protein VFQ07_12265, partial [Candidatus Polarisedimenticolia bacterium]|nr:hypothetical protein [Candidatus Polarisedimenticolia bacterium]